MRFGSWFSGGLGASRRFPEGVEQCRQLRGSARRVCISRTRAGEREEADPGILVRRAERQSRLRRGGGLQGERRLVFQNVRLMKALTQKGYDMTWSWGMNLHGHKF